MKMKPMPFLPSLAAAALSVLTSEGVCLASAAAEVDRAEDAVISWLRSKGGRFSPKLEVRRLFDEDDPTTSHDVGVFATETIAKGEEVVFVPRSCSLTSGGSLDMCDTVLNLAEQFRLKEESDFWPYVKYLSEPGHKGRPIPSSWSDGGLDLIESIVGEELFPTLGVTTMSYENECDQQLPSDDPVLEEAYELVLSRRCPSRWDGVLAPVLDMINHRNGRWENVAYRDNSPAGNDEDITMIALRDIVAGEQLYISYNNCAECEDYALPQLLRDYGFVEQYPRRWSIWSDSDGLVFELDEVTDAGDASATVAAERNDLLEVRWLSDKPGFDYMHEIHGHLKRLKDMSGEVLDRANDLVSNHERSVALEFYEALVTALEQVILSMSAADPELSSSCVSSKIPHDRLEEQEYKVDFFYAMRKVENATEPECHPLVCAIEDAYDVHESYELEGGSKSHYQEIEFYHSAELDDTCLFLNGFVQTCSSVRPHYHEELVHYAAGFVDDIKRILFLGGGDNMILHECLKYPSLELVVGLELDQNVVRSSFKHLGVQPHWDDDRVEWWYGDAAKSLQLLPQDYYGTFDLVIVDLQTDIVRMLGIMDTVMQLPHPMGVVVKNEDQSFATNNPFAKYMVDLYSDDVPYWCHQGMTLASNTVDFLTRRWKDHSVETLLFEVRDDANRFDMWYNYRKSAHLASKGDKGPNSEETEALPTQRAGGLGVLMILEAEGALLPLDASTFVTDRISKALKNAHLTELSMKLSGSKEGDTMVFVLKEGYVVARTWPAHRYCAFDIYLWGSFSSVTGVRDALVAAVGAGKSSSSYRIVAGGMFGVGTEKEDRKVGPPPTCEHPADSIEQVPAKKKRRSTKSNAKKIIQESISLIREKEAVVAVLCGEKGSHCNTLEVLSKDAKAARKHIVPVWSCRSIFADSESTEDAQAMFVCESDTLLSFRDLVKVHGKIGGILIDPTVPRAMGQALHKMFTTARVRKEVLMDDHVVLAISNDPSTPSWRMALLDRFRTDFAKYNPAFAAKVLLNNTSSSMELGVFSTGDHQFYSHLIDVIASIEEASDLISEVQYVKNGLNNYVADFVPSRTFSHDDFRGSSNLEQWLSQQPMGMQTIAQFEMKQESAPSGLSCAQVQEALQTAFLAINLDGMDQTNIQDYNDVGDGCIVVACWSEGSAIVLWEGRTKVETNLFTNEESNQTHVDFKQSFLEKIPSLEIKSFDTQPRGVGRVVNLKEDIGLRDQAPAIWKN